jgi:hypothetical protein
VQFLCSLWFKESGHTFETNALINIGLKD